MLLAARSIIVVVPSNNSCRFVVGFTSASTSHIKRSSVSSSSLLSLSSSSSFFPHPPTKVARRGDFVSFFGSSSSNTHTRLYSSSSVDNNDDDEYSKKKARIVFLGTPDVAATSLQSIVEESKKENSCFEVVGVVTQPPKRRKRGGKVIPSPVGYAAEELEIPVILCPEKAKDVDFLEEMESLNVDLCITAAYGQYLPKRFLKVPKLGTLNIHPSLLPRWRGASPVQRSLEAGDNPIGVSVLFTVSKMDAGPIVTQQTSQIDDNDTATTVLPHLFQLGTQSLIDIIPDVIQRKTTFDTATIQDEQLVLNADLIHSSEGELKVWTDSAKSCHDKTRGFSMWPGTFMYFKIGDDNDSDNDEQQQTPVKVKIIQTRLLPDNDEDDVTTTPITNVVHMGPNKKDGLRVVCGDGSVLELLQVQPATRKAMDAKSYVNGLQGQTLRWVQPPPTPESETS